MIFKRMREQILDKAIRGQLVPQLAEDGVVDQIGDAPTEVPFDIPHNWSVCKLSDVAELITDGSHNPPPNTGSGIPVLSAKDLSNGILTDDNASRWTDDEHWASEFKRCPVQMDDIVLCIVGSIGKVGRVKVKTKVMLQRSLALIRVKESIITKDFFEVFLNSLFCQKWLIKGSAGTAQKGIYLKSIRNLPVILPPITEQKRIASKIESLFGEIDCAEKAYEELQSLANVLRGQILQKAIQGKLVPQLPEDGVVDQIGEAPAEVPFEIPDSWKWITLSDVVDVRDGTHDSPKYVEKGVPFVTSKNLKNGTIDFSTVKFISKKDHESFIQRSNVEPGDILMAMIGSIGNAIMVPENAPEFSIKNVALFKHKADKLLDFEFLLVLLKSLESIMNTQSSGSVQKFVPLKYLRNMAIPLPPLAEQKRIVAKVEALFEQIDLMTK